MYSNKKAPMGMPTKKTMTKAMPKGKPAKTSKPKPKK
jgi:hypothetical protein